MRIAVCVYTPEIDCTENLTQAFAMWGETRLFSTLPSDWRNYDVGLLVDNKTALEEARDYCDEADLIWIGGAISVTCFGQIGGADWLKWGQELRRRGCRIAGHWGDTTYYLYSNYIDGISNHLGITTFVLPDLKPYSNVKAIPLHHPQTLLIGQKTPEISIMHSPGRGVKEIQKGTPAIEEVITELRNEGFEFSYKRITHTPLVECKALKATAHIIIDQLPPEGKPHGLGRSGEEGLSAGAVTLCRTYDPKLVEGFFEFPPVIVVQNQEQLTDELRDLLSDQERRETIQRKSVEWVKANIELSAWLSYIEKYL